MNITEQFLLCGIGMRQLVAWQYLDGTLYPMDISTRPAPLPWQDLGRN